MAIKRLLAGIRSSSKRVIIPFPAPNSTTRLARSSGSGRTSFCAKNGEVGIAPTFLSKSATARAANLPRFTCFFSRVYQLHAPLKLETRS